MAYEVLARKWRPQQFETVVGQDHVTQTLQTAIETNRVAHAYLFVGPRGVGKTSIARIMAKALNCEKNRKGKPCDACSSCKEISAGSNLDVLEIDGASNNGVDQIRDLRDNVKFLPARGPFKIYIIDEVHMLSIGAFNALLKTLEEPPPHVKFIFATTEPQKVPATILSRCQRFDLRRISTGDIAGHLAKIAKAEEIVIDDDAIYALARGAEGGLRDAESALDQVIAFKGRKIVEDDVLQVFGLVSRQQLEGLSAAVLNGSIPDILRIISVLDAAGKDLTRLAAEVLDYFRNLMVMVYAPEVLTAQEVPEQQLAIYKQQAAQVDRERLTRMIDQIIQAQSQLKFALSRRIVLEMALIRAARAASVATLDDVIKSLHDACGDDVSAAPAPAAPRVAPAPAVPRPAPVAETRRPAVTEPPPKRAAEPGVTTTQAAPGGGELEMLSNHWNEICAKVAAAAPLARAYVRDTRPAEVADVSCVIGCDPEFAGHIPYLQHAKCIAAFQHAIAAVLGRKVTVHIKELSQSQTGKLPSDTPVNADADNPSGDAPPAAKTVSAKRKWAEEPAVKRTLEMFNGTISDIRQ